MISIGNDSSITIDIIECISAKYLVVIKKVQHVKWTKAKNPKRLKLPENASNVRSDSERRSDTTAATTRNILNY